jgi:hypothetical protein
VVLIRGWTKNNVAVIAQEEAKTIKKTKWF